MTSKLDNLDYVPWQDEERLRRLYVEQEYSSQMIADQLGCLQKTVLRNMKKCGIKIHRGSDAYRTPDVSEDEDKEKYHDRKHLTTQPHPTRHKKLDTDGKHTFYCTECGCRVTVGPDGTEYGHAGNGGNVTERCPIRDGNHSPETKESPEGSVPGRGTLP